MSTPQQQQEPLPGKLDLNCLKTLIQEDTASLKGQKFVVQVLSLKDVEAEKQNGEQTEKSTKDKMKAVKFKFFLSDGVSQVLTLLNNQVVSKMEDSMESFCVIQITSFIKQNVNNKNILILTRPPKVLYKDIKTKIGCP